jgi:hypothetical protein
MSGGVDRNIEKLYSLSIISGFYGGGQLGRVSGLAPAVEMSRS